MSSIRLSKHFKQRFRERVARTKRIEFFAERAYFEGAPVDKINNQALASKLEYDGHKHGTSARIYNNFIYWFDGDLAITIYPLSQALHGRIK